MNRYHIIGFERLSPRSISFRSLTDYEAVHLQPGRALNSIVLSLRSYPPSAFILPLAASAMSSTSQVPATMPSSSNFQLIINTALKAYEKKTKRDLLADPLMSQLQTCDSSTSILAILQGQVDDLDQAQKSDERLTKWLSPTVNVLLTFSATIGGGVSLVRIKCYSCRTTI